MSDKDTPDRDAARGVIGMVHLMPLVGHPDHPGEDRLRAAALADARSLVAGGVDAIMIENNYDVPHQERIPEAAAAMMESVVRAVSQEAGRPFGICVLWNDYPHALAMAARTGAAFVRVPVFVDDVRTEYGPITADPASVIAARREAGADEVAILTDVQVKHASMVRARPIAESAADSAAAGADGLIVTGQWTADPPLVADLQAVSEAAPGLPLVVGSGATAANVGLIRQYATGVIVGTTLKSGERLDPGQEVNITTAEQRVDRGRVAEFVTAWNATE